MTGVSRWILDLSVAIGNYSNDAQWMYHTQHIRNSCQLPKDRTTRFSEIRCFLGITPHRGSSSMVEGGEDHSAPVQSYTMNCFVSVYQIAHIVGCVMPIGITLNVDILLPKQLSFSANRPPKFAEPWKKGVLYWSCLCMVLQWNKEHNASGRSSYLIYWTSRT